MDLHRQVLQEVFLIQKDYQKILSPRIYRAQTQTVGLQKAYDAILSKNSKIKAQQHAREHMQERLKL